MELPELKAKILKKNIPNILIFSGAEITLKRLYINEIAKQLNLVVSYADIDQVFSQKSNSLIIEPKLSVLLNPKINDKQLEILSKLKHIIICVDELDKRTKLAKEFSNETVEFNFLDNSTLNSIIATKFDLDSNQIDWLVSACENDYGKCLEELDKLKVFRQDFSVKENQKEMFNHLRSLGVFHQEISDKTFQFIDAVSHRNKIETWKLYNEISSLGHIGVELLALLYSRFRMILLVQMIKSPTPDSVGLTLFQINIAKNFINVYKDMELLKIMSLIKETDTNIKLGNIDEDISIPYLLSMIM